MTTVNKSTPTILFLKFSRWKLIEQYWPRLRSSVESLTDEQVWWRPNEVCNSVGNLILHLDGNVRQWLVASFNKSMDARNRPAEFKQRSVIPGSVLLEQLGRTMEEAGQVLARLTETELVTVFEIQGYTVTGLEAVYQVVEHFGLHYGQIVYVTKMLREKDMGFYSELDETGRHKKAVG
jgi:hypothetical protein